jgi:hypothetical protein
MTYIQRFIAWCFSTVLLIAVVTLIYFALTHPDSTAHFITSVVGSLMAAGKGGAEIAINVASGLFF